MTTVEDLGVDKILSWITINRISFNGQFWCWPNPNLRKKEISHTCEESGAHPRICLAFTDELEKQLFIKETAEVGQ